jgi:hypothetical protein
MFRGDVTTPGLHDGRSVLNLAQGAGEHLVEFVVSIAPDAFGADRPTLERAMTNRTDAVAYYCRELLAGEPALALSLHR